MRGLFTLACLVLLVLHCSYAPPVTPEKEQKDEPKDDLEEYIEYQRYLKEVVQALESDPEFRERLEKADEEDVRSGKIADQLDFVHHNVRTKLDEIKRRELERLRSLATKMAVAVHEQLSNMSKKQVDRMTRKALTDIAYLSNRQFEINNKIDHHPYMEVDNEQHLDHNNPHTFEIEDLRRLIKKTTADLEAADKRRREQFKEYEMQKEFEKNMKLQNLDEAHKAQYQEELRKEQEAMKNHKPLHHPGSKQQLEEVWEKQDHMDQQFDPKAFFMMHDVDGNGVWDADEVKALFIKELDKMYSPHGPNKDLHERAEEMERMREHVFNENDHNRDGLIDYNEFIVETKRSPVMPEEEWKPINEEPVYTNAEYTAYEKMRGERSKYLHSLGLADENGNFYPGKENMARKAVQHFQETYYPNHLPAPPPRHPQQGFNPQAAQGQFQLHPSQPRMIQKEIYYDHPTHAIPEYQGHVPQYHIQAPQENIPQRHGYVSPDHGKEAQGHGQVAQGHGQVAQGHGQVAQGHGQVAQGQGQLFQGQVSHGQVPQGQAQHVDTQGQAPSGQNVAPPGAQEGQ